MKKISIVVPCYNEQETIYPFLEETQKVESKMKDQLIFDYIFVNDGSKDETLKVLRDVASRFENVHYLSFSRNFGKEAGLLDLRLQMVILSLLWTSIYKIHLSC